MRDLWHFYKRILPFFIAAALILTAQAGTAFADDDGSDDEYIPDEYYENVQSNDTPGWPQGEAIQASAGVVMDLDTGVFLYSKNCDRQLYPASITKIMTCLLVLENADPDAVMTCSSVVYELDENASNTGLQEGEQMTIRDALYTLMLESANDTANALAEYVSGSISAFADLMNEKAASLGCTGTHFSNPSGLSADDHYTTAHDMALIAAAAYANESFRTICGTVEYEVPPTNMYDDIRYLSNHHRMLQSDSDYYTSWCTGGKTGFTEAAWNTLVTFGEKDGKRLVCVLLHGNGADQNYLETADLMNYGFDNFRHADLSDRFRSLTLSQAMHTDYIGKGAALESDNLSQTLMEYSGSASVSIPNDADASSVSGAADTVSDVSSPDRHISFSFNGWPVGGIYASVKDVDLRMSYPWQTVASVSLEGQTGDKEGEIRDTNDLVWSSVEEYARSAADKADSFVEEHRTGVFLSILVVVAVLVVLLIILIMQSTRESRSRRKMRQAREMAQERENEIDAMSAVEIEEELRRALNEEKERRESDSWKDDPGLSGHGHDGDPEADDDWSDPEDKG